MFSHFVISKVKASLFALLCFCVFSKCGQNIQIEKAIALMPINTSNDFNALSYFDTLIIETNENFYWYVTDTPTWISIAKGGNSYISDTLILKIDSNNTVENRSHTIIITSDDTAIRNFYTINQSGLPFISLNNSTYEIDIVDEDVMVTDRLVSNSGWRIISNNSEGSVSHNIESGNGNAEINFTISKDVSFGEEFEGSFVVQFEVEKNRLLDTLAVNFDITVNSDQTFDISKNFIYLSNDILSDTFNIQTNTVYATNFSDNLSQLTFGNVGPSAFAISATNMVPQTNNLSGEATFVSNISNSSLGSIEIFFKGDDMNFLVDDGVLDYTVDKNVNNLSIPVTNTNATSQWNLKSTKPDWIELLEIPYVGVDTIVLDITENLTNEKRTAVLLFEDNTVKNFIRVTISQTNEASMLEVSPKSINIRHDAIEAEIDVSSNAMWNVYTLQDWITLDKTSGNNDEKITASIAATNSDRLGSVVIYNRRQTIVVTINQENKN